MAHALEAAQQTASHRQPALHARARPAEPQTPAEPHALARRERPSLLFRLRARCPVSELRHPGAIVRRERRAIARY
jgi:hypothetical protein